jgi:hypothetical protein
MVVCMPASSVDDTFPDNVHTVCALCGTPVVHRPYVPKKPPKICMPCIMKMHSGEAN